MSSVLIGVRVPEKKVLLRQEAYRARQELAVPHRKRIFRLQEKMELKNWRLFRVHQLHIQLGGRGNPLVGQ